MIKLVRSTARSSHVCRHPAAAWPLARLLLSGICSVVCLLIGRPSTHTLAWQLQHLSPSAAPSAGRPRCLHLLSTARSPVSGLFSDSRRDAAVIDCPLFPRSRVDVSGGHVSTCCLMKMAAASSTVKAHRRYSLMPTYGNASVLCFTNGRVRTLNNRCWDNYSTAVINPVTRYHVNQDHICLYY